MTSQNTTPERRCERALTAADHAKHAEYRAARAAYDAAGRSAWSLAVFRAEIQQQHAAWCVRSARAVVDYADELSQAVPEVRHAPVCRESYAEGKSMGPDLLPRSELLHRGGCADGESIGFILGYADGMASRGQEVWESADAAWAELVIAEVTS